MLRHPLAYDVVVHRSQLLSYARLHFASEAYLASALSGWLTHVVPGFRLVLARNWRLEVNCLAGRHVSSRPVAAFPNDCAWLRPVSALLTRGFAVGSGAWNCFWNFVCIATF
jgi:hypothetical protein